MNGNANDQDKVNALIFIHHHLHKGLKVQFLQVKNPLTFWKKIEEHYDHTKTLILPQA